MKLKTKELQQALAGYVNYSAQDRINALSKAANWYNDAENQAVFLKTCKLTADTSKNIDRAKKMIDQASNNTSIGEIEAALIGAIRQYQSAYAAIIADDTMRIETYRAKYELEKVAMDANVKAAAAERQSFCDTLKQVFGGVIDFTSDLNQAAPFSYKPDAKLAVLSSLKVDSLKLAFKQGEGLKAIFELSNNVLASAANQPTGDGRYTPSAKLYAQNTPGLLMSIHAAIEAGVIPMRKQRATQAASTPIATPAAAIPIQSAPIPPPPIVNTPVTPINTPPVTPKPPKVAKPIPTPQAGKVAGKWNPKSANGIMYQYLETNANRDIPYNEYEQAFGQLVPGGITQDTKELHPIANTLWYIGTWAKQSGQFSLTVNRKQNYIRLTI